MNRNQKGKPVLTRRRSALRAAAITLTVMVFMVHVMHLGLIFPVQTVWQLEERAGIEHTRVVDRSRTPEIQKTNIAFLSENDEATMFSSCHLTIYGWMANFHVALDCTTDEPLYAGVSYMSRDENRAWYFFGRVDDPEIERVEISLQSRKWNNETQAYFNEEIRRIEDVELQNQSGHRYFLVKDDGAWDSEKDFNPKPVAIGYDSAGNEVAWVDIEDGNFTSFG